MRTKMPAEHADQLRRLNAELRQIECRADDGSAERVLAEIDAVATHHIDDATPLELAVSVRRRVLGCKWNYLARHSAGADLIRQLIDQFDVIGYEHPTCWADIRLELASQYEQESKPKEAEALRAEVRSEVRRIVTELQLLKHI
jgi:hypothetical protein